ncbi:response regulator [Desulfotalea psychrophila]|uniref:Probable two-component system response regulator (Pho family) n=1 Tax=Desulfotalea psychrophila (strain LSv54 / DSM 12343) TaxID=177439 RepID=Q6AQP4_DESPS|nr:response regulator transcription factor [Desulfotalea psychrophila]CAG35329.1 probable two-component system response regulator (Pho family) [Desulfotalea psychrophila LSv54]
MKLLLIEDDLTIADLIQKGLEEAGFAVDSCHNGREGLSHALKGAYSAAIIDIMLPERDGLSIIEEMRAAGKETPVLILSAKQSVDDRIQGLQRGGDDYMIKPFSFGELLVRVQALIRRDQKHSPQTRLSIGPLEMDLLRQQVCRDGGQIELPAKEYALLLYMAENAGTALSKTSILEKVYGYNFDPQTNVVDVLVCRLRAKIDKGFGQQLIQTIRGVGYVLRSH